MKSIISTLIVLSSFQLVAQVNITNKEAQTIIDGVQWEKLGKRTLFQLANAKAECMTLSNYDNKVDFDCIINNSHHEVVLAKRDLERIISITGQKLSPSGLNLKTERANMLCFMNGKCQLTTILSLEEEKHRYCSMSSHSFYTGSLLEETTSKESIIIEDINCTADSVSDFIGNISTLVTTQLKIRGNIGTTIDVDTFYSMESLHGTVDEKVACEAITKNLDRESQQIAIVERQLSQNETTSIRNTDKRLFEQVTLRLSNNMMFNGTKEKQVVKGSFCVN